nr:hypothetical transcript [Hymenolepis microstoma]
MLKVIIFLVYFCSIYARKATPQEKSQIVDSHNQARRNVSPPASNMLAMKYSSEMEYLADTWARKCQFAYPSENNILYRNISQNIAISYGHPSVDFPLFISRWVKEKKNYDYERNSCTPGKTCGHYTQMIWSTSSSVGCAVEQCDPYFSNYPQPVYLYVCQYKPPGNYIGEKPYNAGRRCSECPRETTCRDKLCY